MTEPNDLTAEAASMSTAVQVEHVGFVYLGSSRRHGGEPALDDVSLTVERGTRVGLLGPNGSGKSTLMKILSGLLRPDSGSVTIDGVAPHAGARRGLGVVFQGLGLDPHLTVAENLYDSARLHGLSAAEARERIDVGLEEAGLADRRHDRVKTLSGGLARRVDLCRALLSEPQLLLLDEPTTGLDPSARRAFLDLVEQRQSDSDMTVLMSTHLIDEAERADRIVMMHRGRIIADGSPSDLCAEAGAMRIVVKDSRWMPPSTTNSNWKQVSSRWSRSIEPGDADAASALAASLAGDGVAFSLAPPTLADVFELLTGARLEETFEPAPDAEREAEA